MSGLWGSPDYYLQTVVLKYLPLQANRSHGDCAAILLPTNGYRPFNQGQSKNASVPQTASRNRLLEMAIGCRSECASAATCPEVLPLGCFYSSLVRRENRFEKICGEMPHHRHYESVASNMICIIVPLRQCIRVR